MKIAYLIPGAYTFFQEVIPHLERAGIQVVVNAMPRDVDLVLAAMLPQSHEWLAPLRESDKPKILWHWDLYSFTDYKEPRWVDFLALLPKAADIWSCSYETARQLKEVLGLESYMMPAWVDGEALEKTPYTLHTTNHDYVFAASTDGFAKRWDWLDRACKTLGYPLVTTRNQSVPRNEYLTFLRRCRVYVMCAFEESNGTIPAMEAAACGRPVVMSDLPSCREVFGINTGYSGPHYFNNWDYDGLCYSLNEAWKKGRTARTETLQQRILSHYELKVIARRIIRRLHEVRS